MASKKTSKDGAKTNRDARKKDRPQAVASGLSKAPKTAKSAKKQRRRPRFKIFAIAAAVPALLCFFLFDISRATSNAMLPTLAKGDVVLSFAPRWIGVRASPGDILRVDVSGDVGDVAPNFLRCIASGGDEVAYSHDRFLINGTPLARIELTNRAIVRPQNAPDIWRETLPGGASYRISLPRLAISGFNEGKAKISPGAVFVAGDNRFAAYDSRKFGEIERKNIRGKAILILRSTQNDGLLMRWIKPLR